MQQLHSTIVKDSSFIGILNTPLQPITDDAPCGRVVLVLSVWFGGGAAFEFAQWEKECRKKEDTLFIASQVPAGLLALQ